MAERRRSAHAGDDQNNGGTVSAKTPRDHVPKIASGLVTIKVLCVAIRQRPSDLRIRVTVNDACGKFYANTGQYRGASNIGPTWCLKHFF